MSEREKKINHQNLLKQIQKKKKNLFFYIHKKIKVTLSYSQTDKIRKKKFKLIFEYEIK